MSKNKLLLSLIYLILDESNTLQPAQVNYSDENYLYYFRSPMKIS